jgi:signal transduction histidine kinase
VWLQRLKQTSSAAEKAAVASSLERVAKEVEYFYWYNANLALKDVPASLYSRKVPHKAAGYFERIEGEIRGVKHLFVASFIDWEFANVLFYNAESNEMEEPVYADAAEAVYVAIAPYRLMFDEGLTITAAALTVDERDVSNRIILEPVLGEDGGILGVKGAVVDTGYFRTAVFPGFVEDVIPDSSEAEHFFLRNASGVPVFPADADTESDGDAFVVQRPLPFIFTDWTLELHTHGLTPERWAQTTFNLNLTLSALLALVLLGGIALALRMASREMRLSRMKADFVSNVSHELRTPLASIRVFGEFLRLGRVDGAERVREYGEYIETESRRLTQLVNNILDFSKIESGAKTYRFEPTAPEKVVERILKTFRVRLEHQGFRLEIERPEAPLPKVAMDAQAVGQAFNNLLDNAVKYSGDAHEVTVLLDRTDGFVTIGVRDRGIGISREAQRKIFERFHRAGTSLVHDTKGSGLGLAIVSHIMAAHHGKVTVESEPGRGSTFTLHLPVAGPQTPAAPAAALPDGHGAAS